MEWDHRNYSYGLARAEKAWWGLLRNATREEVKEERRSVGREKLPLKCCRIPAPIQVKVSSGLSAN